MRLRENGYSRVTVQYLIKTSLTMGVRGNLLSFTIGVSGALAAGYWQIQQVTWSSKGPLPNAMPCASLSSGGFTVVPCHCPFP